MSRKAGIRWLHLLSAVAIIFFASNILMPLASSGPDEKLMDFISEIDDPFMTSTDLAFLLATHDFDATPKGDYVEVRTGKSIYRLVPNGSHPGRIDSTVV